MTKTVCTLDDINPQCECQCCFYCDFNEECKSKCSAYDSIEYADDCEYLVKVEDDD